MNATAKPVPQITPDMEPFFEGTRRGELRIQRCDDCGTARFPARAWCSHCLSRRAHWEPASGRGEVFSFTIMHQIYHPSFADEAPYAVVIIALEEGPKLTSNLAGVAPDEVRIGMPVEVVFEPVSDEVALPKFRPRA